jgi:hypothetical protein
MNPGVANTPIPPREFAGGACSVSFLVKSKGFACFQSFVVEVTNVADVSDIACNRDGKDWLLLVGVSMRGYLLDIHL